MTQALYRKWRPKTWDQVAGQDHVIQTLRNAVQGERVAHAYLFAGPRGTGKTTTARLLAKAVNCLEASLNNRPCNQCDNCLAINEARFLDLIEIDAASNTSVDDVRDLRDKINFSPNEGRMKVYIVDEVHMLSTAAFNALLKTLEEPPPHAMFILATTEVHKIPTTVLSRCQRHEFRRIPVAEISSYLQHIVEAEGLVVDEASLELISRQATGSLRDAISLLDQLASTGERVTLDRAQTVLGTATSQGVLSLIEALAQGDLPTGLDIINRALDGGADPRQFARQIVDVLREILLAGTGSEDLLEEPSMVKGQLQDLAGRIPREQTLAAIKAFTRAAVDNRVSWQPSLALELAFVESTNQTQGRTTHKNPAPAAGGVLKDEPSEEDNHPREASHRKDPAEPAENQPADKSREGRGAGGSSSSPASPSQEQEGDLSKVQESQSPTFQSIMDLWKDLLKEVYELNPRTQALLNSCKPLGLKDNALILGFRSDLLREKMEKGHNLELIRRVLSKLFQEDVSIRCVLVDRWQARKSDQGKSPPMEEGGMVATALRDLGAQVVDYEQLPPEGST